MKNLILFFLISLLFNTYTIHAQCGIDWDFAFSNSGIFGSGVGLRETETRHNAQLGPQGNLYLGFQDFPDNYGLASVDPDGNLRWRASYNGSADGMDVLTATAVSPAANCYVTGYTSETDIGQAFTTISYDSEGRMRWMDTFSGPDVVYSEGRSIYVDQDENVFVAGTASRYGFAEDWVLIKYNAWGARQWVVLFDRDLKPDRVAAVTGNPSGSQVFLIGTSINAGSGEDISVLSYSAAAGNLLWEHHFDNPENLLNPDRGVAIATDSSGYVYAVGNSFANPAYDIALFKLREADGSRQWLRRYDGPLNANEGVFDMAVSPAGSVYLGGYTANGNGGTSMLALKYNTNGGLVWEATFGSNTFRNDRISDIILGGPNGSVFAAGSMSSAINQSFGLMLLEFDAASGDTLRACGPGLGYNSGQGMATGLAAGPTGDVYIGGRAQGGFVLVNYGPEQPNAVAEVGAAPSVEAFPNPCPGRLTVRSAASPIRALELFSLDGRRIPARVSISGGQAEVRAGFKGMAILQVATGNDVIVKKVLFE